MALLRTFAGPAPVAPAGAVAAQAVSATKIYGKGDASVVALHEVDVEFASGAFTAIMGPSSLTQPRSDQGFAVETGDP